MCAFMCSRVSNRLVKMIRLKQEIHPQLELETETLFFSQSLIKETQNQ